MPFFTFDCSYPYPSYLSFPDKGVRILRTGTAASLQRWASTSVVPLLPVEPDGYDLCDRWEASALHCVVTGAKDADMVRLYDLGSANGTYVNDERIQAVSLSHFSEFRIGSTTLGVTIVSKHSNETT